MKRAIVHYRDDLDLQNLMDYTQKEVLWPIPLSQSGCACVCSYPHHTSLQIDHSWWFIEYIGALNQETTETTELYVLCLVILALLGVFHMRGSMLHTVTVLCGSPHVIFLFHLHVLAHLWAWVFPLQKPRLAGCTVQGKTMFLNI